MSVENGKTVHEMRDRILTRCSSVGCDGCPLLDQKWEHPLANPDFGYCLEVRRATVDELDKALSLLEADDSEIEGAPETIEEDPVNHPSHYTGGGIECLDALEASMTPIEYAGFLKGQVFKYLWRYRLKGNPVQDLSKARFYLDRLIRCTEVAAE